MTDEPEPPPTGRRAGNRASRAAFVIAREHGLVARHRAKLAHLRERAAKAGDESTDQPPKDLP